MKVDLTEEQIKILYQVVVQSNWNGQQLERALELKNLLGKKVEEILQKPSFRQDGNIGINPAETPQMQESSGEKE